MQYLQNSIRPNFEKREKPDNIDVYINCPIFFDIQFYFILFFFHYYINLALIYKKKIWRFT